MDTIETIERLLEVAKEIKKKTDESGVIDFDDLVESWNDSDNFHDYPSLKDWLKHLESFYEDIDEYIEDFHEELADRMI